jgi:di/tricarboxylate transporter
MDSHRLGRLTDFDRALRDPVLKPEEALSGFSSEPAIVIAGIFVLSGALHVTGLSDMIGAWIGKLAGQSLTRALVVIMPAVGLLSAFTHHVTTTAIMLPITMDISRERDIPASKLLMPMSFAGFAGHDHHDHWRPCFSNRRAHFCSNRARGPGNFFDCAYRPAL